MYRNILQGKLKPALGCTEPVAVALAVATAAVAAGRPVDRVSVTVSGNILKNAMSVGIPGTDLVGLEIASALAAVAGSPEAMLEVLRGITAEDAASARDMVDAGKITINLAETDLLFFIEASCHGTQGHGVVRVENTHTGIVSVCLNGEEIASQRPADTVAAQVRKESMNLAGLYAYAMEADLAELEFLQEAIDMNERISREGLEQGSGLGIGKALLHTCPDGDSPGDLAVYAAACTAAASDARMAGCCIPVMTTSGSGNQGITATVPISSIAGRMGSNRDTLLRAIALSQLVTIYVKEQIGTLSAICGCAVASSVGAACGITHLYGGGYREVEAAAINMVADITGMICDGAKAGCALKIATAVTGAMQCAQLALRGVVISGRDGIVCADGDSTIRNLGRLANPGMVDTDRVILDIMLDKKRATAIPV